MLRIHPAGGLWPSRLRRPSPEKPLSFLQKFMMKIYTLALISFLAPSTTLASTVNLECLLSSEQSRNNMVLSVDLDKVKREAIVTKENGSSFRAEALLSPHSIQLKKTRNGPPGMVMVERYTVDRTTLAITGIPNIPTQFPAFQLETVSPQFNGHCKLQKPNPNRKI